MAASTWGIFDATTSPRCAIGVAPCAWGLTPPSWKLPLRLRRDEPRGGAGSNARASECVEGERRGNYSICLVPKAGIRLLHTRPYPDLSSFPRFRGKLVGLPRWYRVIPSHTISPVR